MKNVAWFWLAFCAMALTAAPGGRYRLQSIADQTGVPIRCIEAAAEKFNLPKILMYAVLTVEAGKPGLEKNNKLNNTTDYGPAQINTINLKRLAKNGYALIEIKNNPCKNIEASAFLMSACVDQNADWRTGIGCYHSNTPEHNFKYRLMLYRAMKNIAQATRK